MISANGTKRTNPHPKLLKYLRLGTGTVCTGSTNLLIGPGQWPVYSPVFFSSRTPENDALLIAETRFMRSGRKEERQYTAAIQYTD